MPKYPPLALLARIEGEVKVTFLLNGKGEVESVEIKSGPTMLRDATADIVKSWKFKLPDLLRTEWKYETAFRYHFSAKSCNRRKLPILQLSLLPSIELM